MLPRLTSGPTRKSSGSEFAGDLKSIEETPDRDDTDEIHGNTPCRIIYNAAKRYPNLKLPSTVFTKLYYYSSRLWEENDLMCLMVPEKKGYYDVFFNELVINEKLAESRLLPIIQNSLFLVIGTVFQTIRCTYLKL